MTLSGVVARDVACPPMTDTVDFDRFIEAQAPVLANVKAELAAGAKRSHWMWFIFPQLAGLGHSSMARHYALASLAEARAYLAHPVLGPRLVEYTELVNAVKGRSINRIMGSPDDMKFRSSMTLFAAADPGIPAFSTALDLYFDGAADPLTTRMLSQAG